MIAYPGLYFLDVPKTGTTRIREVLDFALGTAQEVKSHRPLPRKYDADRLRLLSVREPLSLYLSLFRYGCDGRGRLYARLAEAGQGGRYVPTQAGFTNWLVWILNPDHADLIGLGYGDGRIAQMIGFASHMTLSLAIPGARGVMTRAQGRFDLTARLDRRKFRPDGIIHNADLEGDLLAFLHANRGGLPMRKSMEDVAAFLSDRRRVNTSHAGAGMSVERLPADLCACVRDRDWMLYERYFSGEHAA